MIVLRATAHHETGRLSTSFSEIGEAMDWGESQLDRYDYYTIVSIDWPVGIESPAYDSRDPFGLCEWTGDEVSHRVA